MINYQNIAIITARKGSRRIKNKNLKNFFGKPVIYYSIENLKKTKLFDEIIIATTTNPNDNDIIAHEELLYQRSEPRTYQWDHRGRWFRFVYNDIPSTTLPNYTDMCLNIETLYKSNATELKIANDSQNITSVNHGDSDSAYQIVLSDISGVKLRTTDGTGIAPDHSKQEALYVHPRDASGDSKLAFTVSGDQGAKSLFVGLRDDNKTIGSYLFVGPTGVGKTEIAKVLSSVLNIDLLRFDMSEYMERHSISRLIGSPPGYVGFDQGGALTEAVNKSPNSVVLLDEIEKAHPDVFNILLQIMDYGKLTDHNSRTVDFRNTILIMTSNVGAEALEKNSVGFTNSNIDRDNETQINRMFAPEFRNRLDSIIQFDFLSKKVMKSIVDKAINILDGQLAEKNISISLSNSAKDYLIEEGYDRKFGARPLERLIQKKIKEPLADEIIFGKLKKGGKVIVEFNKEQLKIKLTK